MATAHHPAERIARVTRALQDTELDALVCALPMNVLLLSGYWPVVGTALAVVSREGNAVVIAPEDEADLAARGWAEVRTFQPGSLAEIRTVADAVRGPLADLARDLGIERGRVGYEGAEASEPASYAAMHLYGAGIVPLLRRVLPVAPLVPADGLLARLRSVKTPGEIDRLRAACGIAEGAFLRGAAHLALGMTETEAAALFRRPLSTEGTGHGSVARADGFTFCMSGANAAEAFGAYARSRAKALAPNDLVLVHCNSYADGYWTDVTRTYYLGEPDVRQRELYDAVFAARAAALRVIRPGVRAADVDQAARRVLTDRGFGADFKHATGHGVGFGAIDHTAPPRLHPASTDVLEVGMTFNVEPAIYVDGYGGLRHCDVVAVTEEGVEVLTPFQLGLEDLTI